MLLVLATRTPLPPPPPPPPQHLPLSDPLRKKKDLFLANSVGAYLESDKFGHVQFDK